ncbi:hypothetical protein GWK47_013366 [Chionoecetes opilio]|uniref:Tesmin/TSO1-like CXC domain-containing protein n=1 Tax=Chionoecetes opilio TaxID=41210 RepID=A0A8J4XY03_CHIOP|nr:hypothetical protein GWK47_013366 [Chionoecetes opilio]
MLWRESWTKRQHVRYPIQTLNLQHGQKKCCVSSPTEDSSSYTSEAFVENVKRAHFQACIWRSALTGEAPDMDPLENGWVSDDDFGVLMPVTLPSQTEIAPAAVMKLIQCGCSSETPCSTERCGCVAGQMSCSAFCRCRAEIRTCRNRWTLLKQRIEDANDSDEDESNDGDDSDD